MSDLEENNEDAEVLENEDSIDEPAPQESEGLSVEDKAKSMGWRPKDEYKGKQEHVDAETYVKDAEEDFTKNRKALNKLQQNYDRLEQNTEAIMNHQTRQTEAAEKAGYDRAMSEIEGRMEKAVEESDYDAVNAAVKDRDELKNKNQPKDIDPNKQIFDAWLDQNPWFRDDPYLEDMAARKSDQLARSGASVKEQLEGATKYIKDTFPDKFPEERRNQRRAPHMNGSGNNLNGIKPKAGTYEALTKEYRKECDRFVSEATRRNQDPKQAKSVFMDNTIPEMFEK